MIVIEKNVGPKIPYEVNGTKITFDDDLMLNLAKRQDEEPVHIVISRNKARALQIGGEDIPAPDVVAATFRQMRESIVRSASDDVEVELSDSVWLRPGSASATR